MAQDKPIQFASPAWIDLIETTLQDLLAELRARGQAPDWTISFSQTWTDVPPDGGTGRWAVLFRDGQATFTREAVSTDVGIVGTYEAGLPIARFVFGTATPQAMAELQAYWDGRRATGELRDIGLLAQAPRAFQKLIMALHDRQAGLIV